MAETALVKQLHKAFTYIGQALLIYNDNLKPTREVLDSLQNLCEQFVSCTKMDPDMMGLGDLPNIKTLTLAKIQIQLEKLMTELYSITSEFEGVSVQMSRLVSSIEDVYNQNTDTLNLELMTTASATQPSYATMIELIHSADQLFYLNYIERWQRLREVDYTDIGSTQALRDVWLNTSNLVHNLKFTLGQVQFFMEDKR